MPLPDALPDKRIYELLKTVDLENLSFADFQGVAKTIYAEQGAEDELRRIILVNLARLSVKGEWNGLTSAGGGGGNQLVPNGEQGWGTSARFNLHKSMPFNNAPDAYTTFACGSLGSRATFYPFLAGHTGTVDEIGIEVGTTASGRNILIGIYETGPDGMPLTLLGSASVPVSSSGKVYQTSITGTIELTKGTQYYVAFVRDNSSGWFSSTWYWSEDTGTQYSTNAYYELDRTVNQGCTIIQSSGSTYALDSDLTGVTFYSGAHSGVGIPCISVSFS